MNKPVQPARTARRSLIILLIALAVCAVAFHLTPPLYDQVQNWRGNRLIQKSHELIANGQWDKALKKAELAKKLDADVLGLFRELVETGRNHDIQKALTLSAKVYKFPNATDDDRRTFVELCMATGNLAAAKFAIRETVSKISENTQISETAKNLSLLAKISAAEKNWVAAEILVNQLLTLCPDAPESVRAAAEVFSAKGSHESLISLTKLFDKLKVAYRENSNIRSENTNIRSLTLLWGHVLAQNGDIYSEQQGVSLLLELGQQEDRVALIALHLLVKLPNIDRDSLRQAVELLEKHPLADQEHQLLAIEGRIKLSPSHRPELIEGAIQRFAHKDTTTNPEQAQKNGDAKDKEAEPSGDQGQSGEPLQAISNQTPKELLDNVNETRKSTSFLPEKLEGEIQSTSGLYYKDPYSFSSTVTDSSVPVDIIEQIGARDRDPLTHVQMPKLPSIVLQPSVQDKPLKNIPKIPTEAEIAAASSTPILPKLISLAAWLNSLGASISALELLPLDVILAQKQSDALLVHVDALIKLRAFDAARELIDQADTTLSPLQKEVLLTEISQKQMKPQEAKMHWVNTMTHARDMPGSDYTLAALWMFAKDRVRLEKNTKFLFETVAWRQDSDALARTLKEMYERGNTRRVFGIISTMRKQFPSDPLNINNHAYISLLLKVNLNTALNDALELVKKYRDDPGYRATAALGYLRNKRPKEAYGILVDNVTDWHKLLNADKVVYAAVLSSNSQQELAKQIAKEIDEPALLPEELELLQRALKDKPLGRYASEEPEAPLKPGEEAKIQSLTAFGLRSDAEKEKEEDAENGAESEKAKPSAEEIDAVEETAEPQGEEIDAVEETAEPQGEELPNPTE